MTAVSITQQQFIDIVETMTEQHPEWAGAIILATVSGMRQRIIDESVARANAETALIMAYDVLDPEQTDPEVFDRVETSVVAALLIQGTEYQRTIARRAAVRKTANSGA